MIICRPGTPWAHCNSCGLFIVKEEKNPMKLYMRLNWVYLVIAAMLISGCFGGHKSKVSDDLIPRYHVWNTLTSFGDEEQGYGLYTYVIIDGNTNTRTDGGKRNEALLKAIAEPAANPGEALRSPVNPSGVFKQECNIFYIPLTQKMLPQFASPLALYNLPLAQQLVAGFVRSMREEGDMSRRLMYSTPFLVSLPVPLPGLGYRPAKMLIADLSSTGPDDMRQIVAAFRQKQNSNVGDDLDRFRLIRLELLGGVLPLNYISVVNTVPADTIPLDSYGR
jgi:hypothetical protein